MPNTDAALEFQWPQPREHLLSCVRRIGTHGEWFGDVEHEPTREVVYYTGRINGRGAKARAQQMCDDWITKHSTPTAKENC